jgi:hypothetical protein
MTANNKLDRRAAFEQPSLVIDGRSKQYPGKILRLSVPSSRFPEHPLPLPIRCPRMEPQAKLFDDPIRYE